MIDLTSKTKILPDGSKFPDTPMPIIIRENFSTVEVINPNKGDFYVEDSRFMRLTIGISEDIKNKIINDLTYEQMLEIESDLSEWKWNNLLGEAPENFDTLPDYEGKWYKRTWLYRMLFKNRTKSDYTRPIREFIECFLTKRDMFYYREVIKYKNMTAEEFEEFWIQYCLRERVSIIVNINLG